MINQHTALQIDALYTKDDDYILSLREFSKEAIEKVKCVISRFIIKICTQSFSHTVMLGCTIKDTSKLAFDISGEYATARQETVNELITLGMEEVAFAFYNNAEITPVESEGKTPRCPVQHSSFCPTRYKGPTEADRLQILADHPGIFGEVLWQVKLEQWGKSRYVKSGER